MNDDPVCRLWQSAPEGADNDMQKMLEVIQKKAKSFNRAIYWRDAREITVALPMAMLFFYSGFTTLPRPLISAGFYLAALSCLFIAGWLWRSRRLHSRAAPDQSVAAYGLEVLEGYDRQIALLRTAKYWYVLPLSISAATIFAGVIVQMAGPMARLWQQSPGRWFVATGLLMASVTTAAAVMGFVWWLNEKYMVPKLIGERDRLAALLPVEDSD